MKTINSLRILSIMLLLSIATIRPMGMLGAEEPESLSEILKPATEVALNNSWTTKFGGWFGSAKDKVQNVWANRPSKEQLKTQATDIAKTGWNTVSTAAANHPYITKGLIATAVAVPAVYGIAKAIQKYKGSQQEVASNDSVKREIVSTLENIKEQLPINLIKDVEVALEEDMNLFERTGAGFSLKESKLILLLDSIKVDSIKSAIDELLKQIVLYPIGDERYTRETIEVAYLNAKKALQEFLAPQPKPSLITLAKDRMNIAPKDRRNPTPKVSNLRKSKAAAQEVVQPSLINHVVSSAKNMAPDKVTAAVTAGAVATVAAAYETYASGLLGKACNLVTGIDYTKHTQAVKSGISTACSTVSKFARNNKMNLGLGAGALATLGATVYATKKLANDEPTFTQDAQEEIDLSFSLRK